MAKIRGKKMRKSNGKRKSSAAFKPDRKQSRKRTKTGSRGHRKVRNAPSSAMPDHPSTQEEWNEIEAGPLGILDDDIDLNEATADAEPGEPDARELSAERIRRRGQSEHIADDDTPE